MIPQVTPAEYRRVMGEQQMDDDLKQKVEALPPVPKAFVEGYGEGVGYKDEINKRYVDVEEKSPHGYGLNISAATNRVCLRCGAVVADADLHDAFHDRIEPVELEEMETSD